MAIAIAPILGMTGRICTKDWPVPGDSFVIPKRTRVIIPIVSDMQNLWNLQQEKACNKSVCSFLFPDSFIQLAIVLDCCITSSYFVSRKSLSTYLSYINLPWLKFIYFCNRLDFILTLTIGQIRQNLTQKDSAAKIRATSIPSLFKHLDLDQGFF